MKPKLPTAAEILPYLETIDARRWYSNWGPLAIRLEEQLARRLDVGSESVVTTGSGTAGLTAALLAREICAGSFCIMPSWTFSATPHAARAAGLVPWFHDVDPRTWALDPAAVAESIKHMHTRPGAVLAVSPFGAPIGVGGWEAFEDHTGIPVIIDAAAGFDTVQASKIPCVVSLHATKILGAGEGGFVATTDAGLADRIRACCNFGFRDSRTAMLPAINGKMSEYHAAVALASLAAWPQTRAQHARISQCYREAFAPLQDVAPQPGYGIGWVSSTTSVGVLSGSAASISQRLEQAGVETRAWWGAGCHAQPAFRDCPREALPVTEDLGGKVLGLPHYFDLRQVDMETVAGALAEILAGRALQRLGEVLQRQVAVPVRD